MAAEELKQRIDEAIAVIEQKRIEINQLVNDKTEKEEELLAAQQACEHLVEVLKNLNEVIQRMETDQAKLSQLVAQSQSVLVAKQAELARNVNQLAELQIVQADLNAQKKSIFDEFVKENNLQNQIVTGLEESRTNMSQLSNQIDGATTKEADAKNEMEKLAASLLSSIGDINVLMGKINTSQSELNKCDSDVQKLEQDVALLQQELADADSEEKRSKREETAATSARNKAAADLTNAKEALAKATTELNTANEELKTATKELSDSEMSLTQAEAKEQQTQRAVNAAYAVLAAAIAAAAFTFGLSAGAVAAAYAALAAVKVRSFYFSLH